MPSFEYDLRYLQAGVDLLEDYLLSTDLYWPVGANPPRGEPPYPRMTLSGMLLADQRLHALAQTPDEEAKLARIDEQMDATRSRWRTAWEQKCAREFHARLALWANFMEDYRQNPGNNADRYAYEVSRRVQLHLLSQEAGDLPEAETNLLAGLDKLLQGVFLPGEFIWNARLASSFPNQVYWYLYGHLRS
jgi:hypothetical protein